MNKISCLSLLTALCGFSSLLHADITLVQQIDGFGPDLDSTIQFKNGRTRVDAPAPLDASVIVDLKSGEVTSLMHAQKSYMKVPGPMAQAALSAVQQSPYMPKDVALTLTATGKKDTISGYAAEEYTAAIAGVKMSVWLTKAVPNYASMLTEVAAAFAQGPMGAIIKTVGLDIAALPGIPVRVVNELPSGQTVTSTTVSISTNPIADSTFDIPADYKQTPIALPFGAQPAS